MAHQKEDILRNDKIKLMLTWSEETQKFCADLVYEGKGNIQGYGDTVDEALQNAREACVKDFS